MTPAPRRAVVAGGAGLVGSHLCRALLAAGAEVVCVDNLSTADGRNVADLSGDPRFELLVADVTEPFAVGGPIDAVLHLASPASPPDYLRLPIETLQAGSAGTERLVRLAEHHGARFLLASTSEVYGEPLEHPQQEAYWGNVNPVGPRGVYDEAKRYAEALTSAFRRAHGVDTAIVRIFNTYGPGMRPDDGRVVSNFLAAALRGDPLTIYGDGSQTRSFCYVDDEVRGILALLQSDLAGPVNIGNPAEITIAQLAGVVLEVTGSHSSVTFHPLPVDDPSHRRPDITLASNALGWKPEVKLRDGLAMTARWFEELSSARPG